MAIPAFEYEGEAEAEWEGEALHELNPVRKVYPDAMLEHLGHLAAEAESENEAAEGFLPLVPMVASRLLPTAARSLPRLMRALPRISRAVSSVTPQLTRGVSGITRALFRNPNTRPLVRVVPSLARRTVATIASQAARGVPVNPRTAQGILVRQTRQVLRNPQQAALLLRRAGRIDRQFHRLAGVPLTPVRSCPTCGVPVRRARRCCRLCGQLTIRLG